MSTFTPIMYAYYLILLSLIRFLGVIIFFDYYRKEKRIRFIALTGAFLFLTMSSFIEFLFIDFSDNTLYEFIYLISEIFALLGVYVLVLIFFDYVSEYDKKIELFIGALISIGVLLLYFVIPFDIIYLIIQIIFFIIITSVFVNAINNRTHYMALTNNSIYFFILMAVLIVFNLILTIIPSNLELEIVLTLSSISLSAFGIFIYVHLEYNLLLNHKYLLKDDYSHKLAQILQAIMGRVEFAKGGIDSVEVESQLDKAIEDCTKGSNLLYKIREL